MASCARGSITLSIDPAIKNNGYCIFYTSPTRIEPQGLPDSYENAYIALRNMVMTNAFGHIRLLDVGKFSLVADTSEKKVTSALQVSDGIKKSLDAVVAHTRKFAEKCEVPDANIRIIIEVPHRCNFKLIKIYGNMAFYLKTILKLHVKEIKASAKTKFMNKFPFEQPDIDEFSKPKTQYLKRKVKAVCTMRFMLDSLPAHFVVTDNAKKILRDSRKTELRDIADAFVQYFAT